MTSEPPLEIKPAPCESDRSLDTARVRPPTPHTPTHPPHTHFPLPSYIPPPSPSLPAPPPPPPPPQSSLPTTYLQGVQLVKLQRPVGQRHGLLVGGLAARLVALARGLVRPVVGQLLQHALLAGQRLDGHVVALAVAAPARQDALPVGDDAAEGDVVPRHVGQGRGLAQALVHDDTLLTHLAGRENKEAWCLTSTETGRFIRDGGKGVWRWRGERAIFFSFPF